MFWSKKIFFSNSRKIFPTKEMHSIALIIVHVKNWPQRSKRFNQPLKSKIQPLTARADRLTFWPKLMQFRVGVHYTLGFARKTLLSLRVCSVWFVYVYAHVRINVFSDQAGSGGSVVDNTLDYQHRDHKINTPLLRSFGWDFKPRSRLRMIPSSLWSGCTDIFLDLSLHHTVRSSNATRAEQNSPNSVCLNH